MLRRHHPWSLGECGGLHGYFADLLNSIASVERGANVSSNGIVSTQGLNVSRPYAYTTPLGLTLAPLSTDDVVFRKAAHYP